MNKLLHALQSCGWEVKQDSVLVPEDLDVRLGREVPPEILSLIAQFSTCTNADYSAWLLSVADYLGTSDSAFAWDEWEKLSVGAAAGDSELLCEVQQFWAEHIPFVMSVKDGYAYLAIRLRTGEIVFGEEPEFEEIETIAVSLHVLADFISGGILPARVQQCFGWFA